MPEAIVVHDSTLVNFLKMIIGGLGKNSTVKPEFFPAIRVMPDLDIFPDSLSAQLIVFNQIKHFVILHCRGF